MKSKLMDNQHSFFSKL